ncbi:hypothetical protein N2152v2_001623 [Parachlorella kessleri]
MKSLQLSLAVVLMLQAFAVGARDVKQLDLLSATTQQHEAQAESAVQPERGAPRRLLDTVLEARLNAIARFEAIQAERALTPKEAHRLAQLRGLVGDSQPAGTPSPTEADAPLDTPEPALVAPEGTETTPASPEPTPAAPAVPADPAPTVDDTSSATGGPDGTPSPAQPAPAALQLKSEYTPIGDSPSPQAPVTPAPAGDFSGGNCPDPQAALEAHNIVRAAHNAPPLQWSVGLAQSAQAWANTCTFAHSGGPYGENLMSYGVASCASAVEGWASEVSLWPPGSNDWIHDAGHFTQVVWKETTLVGCGWTDCGGPGLIFMLCQYYYRGNILGHFVENVL